MENFLDKNFMPNKNNGEPTLHDVLNSISSFADSVESRFDSVGERFDKLEGEVKNIKGEIIAIKATMVTKDYLDTKVADLRGDLVVMMRKEDVKLKTLIEILRDKKILDKKEVKQILSLEPFPALAL